MQESPSTTQGFSFIETLVAISVLTIGIMGPLTIVVETLQSAQIARDQVIAHYLAEEGLEYIRYIRDTNVLRNADWLSNDGMQNDCGGDGDPCEIQDITNVVGNGAPDIMGNGNCSLPPPLACPPVAYSNGQSRYGANGSNTIFTRKIVVTETVDNVEAEVVVTVMWNTQAGTMRSLDARERIFNWSGQ